MHKYKINAEHVKFWLISIWWGYVFPFSINEHSICAIVSFYWIVCTKFFQIPMYIPWVMVMGCNTKEDSYLLFTWLFEWSTKRNSILWTFWKSKVWPVWVTMVIKVHFWSRDQIAQNIAFGTTRPDPQGQKAPIKQKAFVRWSAVCKSKDCFEMKVTHKWPLYIDGHFFAICKTVVQTVILRCLL